MAPTVTPTRHLHTRFQQRGFKERVLDLMVRHATHTSRGYLLTGKDIAEVKREFKRDLNDLRKLQDVFVVADGETLITAYRTNKRQRRGLLESR